MPSRPGPLIWTRSPLKMGPIMLIRRKAIPISQFGEPQVAHAHRRGRFMGYHGTRLWWSSSASPDSRVPLPRPGRPIHGVIHVVRSKYTCICISMVAAVASGPHKTPDARLGTRLAKCHHSQVEDTPRWKPRTTLWVSHKVSPLEKRAFGRKP